MQAELAGDQDESVVASNGELDLPAGVHVIVDFLQRNASTVSRFESGEYPIRRPDLMALLDLYGVSDRRKRDGLLRLAEDVWQKGWWDGYEELERQFVDYVWLESRANTIRAFDCILLPGLLQTRDYAQAVITAADWEAEPAQITRWVQVRMDRQAILHQDAPPQISVIIDSYSPNAGGNCVEVGVLLDATGRVAVRHSHHPHGPALICAHPTWAVFVTSAKNDAFTPRSPAC
ncbi:MAG: Scr1 family TA system antitoxin-like transcriptional regulator [Pseudonocardiaceae bacterium]